MKGTHFLANGFCFKRILKSSGVGMFATGLFLQLFQQPTLAFVLAPTQAKWGSPIYGTPANVTWSIIGNGVSCTFEFAGCINKVVSDINPGFAAEIQRGLDQWSSVANINFTQVPDNGLPYNDPKALLGNLRFGAHPVDGPRGVLAHAFYPQRSAATIAGDVHFDQAENWQLNSLDGNLNTIDIYYVSTHETGHAVGLAHSNIAKSVMAPVYREDLSVLQPDDIAGIQYIYGQRVPAPKQCNLPTLPGNVHLDLIPGHPQIIDGCAVLNPGQTIRRNFVDDLNSRQKWSWQTQFKNISMLPRNFVARWNFPNGGSPITRRISLPAGEIFGITIPVQDNPPELGFWNYTASSRLPYAIGLDTSVTELLNIAAGGSLVFDSATPDQIFPLEDPFDPDITYYVSDPDNVTFEETSDPPDIFFESEVPVPAPLSVLGFGAIASSLRRLRKYSKSMRILGKL